MRAYPDLAADPDFPGWQGRKPPADVFHLYRGEEVAGLLSESGFRRPHVERYPHREKPGQCILAVK